MLTVVAPPFVYRINIQWLPEIEDSTEACIEVPDARTTFKRTGISVAPTDPRIHCVHRSPPCYDHTD